MAIWQYRFRILPKEYESEMRSGYILEGGDFDLVEEYLWAMYAYKKDEFKEFSALLCKNKSWCDEIDLYGEQDSNCLEVLYDGNSNIVLSVSLRIDFRIDYDFILKGVIEFCILHGLIIIDEDKSILQLNFETIRGCVEDSPQVKKYKYLFYS